MQLFPINVRSKTVVLKPNLVDYLPGNAINTRRHPGRQPSPPELPRVERVIACMPEQCVCRRCGQPTTVIGYEESQQLEVEPAKYFVLVTKREKRACKACAEGVVTAPLPARIIEKGLVSDRIVIDTIININPIIVRCTGKA